MNLPRSIFSLAAGAAALSTAACQTSGVNPGIQQSSTCYDQFSQAVQCPRGVWAGSQIQVAYPPQQQQQVYVAARPQPQVQYVPVQQAPQVQYAPVQQPYYYVPSRQSYYQGNPDGISRNEALVINQVVRTVGNVAIASIINEGRTNRANIFANTYNNRNYRNYNQPQPVCRGRDRRGGVHIFPC